METVGHWHAVLLMDYAILAAGCSLVINLVLVVHVLTLSRRLYKDRGTIERLNLMIQRRDWILREEKALIEELEEQEQ